MKFLIIDSHKGNQTTPQNLHWLNADKIRNHLVSLGHTVDLIWSYPTVNDTINVGYDCIIFNHASRYSYISDEWLHKNSTAKLFYITNEYNLGEPLVLWSWVKNREEKFRVISNHEMSASKVVKKYIESWDIVNLNTLILEDTPKVISHGFFDFKKEKCIYYGTFRKNREKYFRKYMNGNVLISTHAKNRSKFESIGVTGPFRDRINWSEEGLKLYKTSLYIEDESTHTNYNFLANRFYEALNYGVFPLFDISCMNTLKLSGYDIPSYAMVDNPEQIEYITEHLPDSSINQLSSWRSKALEEKRIVLEHITKLITT
jgi:hypothetical protein